MGDKFMIIEPPILKYHDIILPKLSIFQSPIAKIDHHKNKLRNDLSMIINSTMILSYDNYIINIVTKIPSKNISYIESLWEKLSLNCKIKNFIDNFVKEWFETKFNDKPWFYYVDVEFIKKHMIDLKIRQKTSMKINSYHRNYFK